MNYTVEYKTAKITISELFEHLQPDKPEGYCSNCEKKGKFWSCPPFDFNARDLLSAYNHVLIIGGKVRANEGYDLVESYYASRKIIGDRLIQLAHDEKYEVLIAGNCYLCSPCQKELGNECINKRDMKYSLESLGFLVSSLTRKVLNEEPQWHKSGKEPSHLLNVSAVLVKEASHLEGVEKKLSIDI